MKKPKYEILINGQPVVAFEAWEVYSKDNLNVDIEVKKYYHKNECEVDEKMCHIVTENDDGIRPAGKPDECFYCQQKVGQKHLFECVMVKVNSSYQVYLDNKCIGIWKIDEPVFWDYDQRYFHRNEGTWCCNSMKDTGTLLLNDVDTEIPWDLDDSDTCTLCSHIELIPIEGKST